MTEFECHYEGIWKILLDEISDDDRNVSLNFFEPKVNFSNNLTKASPMNIGSYSTEIDGMSTEITITVSSILPWICDIESEDSNIGEFIKKEGTDGEEMKFKVSKNVTGEERNFRFIFTNGQKTISTDLITQEAYKTPFYFKALLISPLGNKILPEGGEIKITTMSNETVEFSVFINEKRQILTPEESRKAPGTNTFTYLVGPNPKYGEIRDVRVEIYEKSQIQMVYYFTQNMLFENISVTPKVLRFNKDGGDKNLVVEYNGNYEDLKFSITGDIEGASIIESGAKNITVHLEPLPMRKLDQTGQLIISGLSRTITVNITQEKNEIIIRPTREL